jgi:hypothetical protein
MKVGFVFVAPDFDFVAENLVFVAPGFDFVAVHLDFVVFGSGGARTPPSWVESYGCSGFYRLDWMWFLRTG